jgi:superfamily I DNA and RNA helicase
MIERNINEILLNSEPSAKSLVKLLFDIDGTKDLGSCSVYHNFPLYPANDYSKPITANILFCSKTYGIFIFKCIDYSSRLSLEKEAIIEDLDQIDRIIFAKILKDSPNLRKGRRELKVKIKPVIYINNYNKNDTSEGELDFEDFSVITSAFELEPIIKYDKDEITEVEFKDLKATIEGSKGIPKPVERGVKPTDEKVLTKGAILTVIENEICNFDLEQKRAALFTLDGAQRIRGLAGSGKTIILAMKAAIIHLQNPNAEILYTYYTKALHDVVKRLITRFYRQFADTDPDWRKIHIIHAWGGKTLEGVYYNACIANFIPPINLTDAKLKTTRDPFEYVCKQLLSSSLEAYYDYSLLDEAQDFPMPFYQLCRKLTKNNKVVWAYDDFQNILKVKLQSEKETFGKDEVTGEWHIDFERKEDELQDLVLHQCYRNPRKILITAFALGLGIYNEDEKGKIHIIQRLESNDHWKSLGFDVDLGDSKQGDSMSISRPAKNSPLLKNLHLDNENEIIKIVSCSSIESECDKVIELVINDLQKELNPEDISIICLDDRNARSYFDDISAQLGSNRIKSFNLFKAPNDNTVYKVKDHITLSTIYKAKGNEAGSIYIMGIDTVFSKPNDITERNKLFTAMTRAQGWVTLTGTGEKHLKRCLDEYNRLKENEFKLNFIQPSEEDVRTIRQDINKKQSALNAFERLTNDLAKDYGIQKDILMEDIKNELNKKK